MHEFEFATAKQILFGIGKAKQLPELAQRHGLGRCLIVTGSKPERVPWVTDALRKQGIESTLFPVYGEPSLDAAREGVKRASEEGCEGVIAIGGGSALDAGKAIAMLMRNDGDVLDYLEVIGKGQPVEHPSAPWIAIPTTSGTGAEVTRNAVLFSPEARIKVSLRSPWMLPAVAIVDPELTLDLPRTQTAWSGMDTLTQLIEPYVSSRANPMTDGFCLEGLPLVASALPRVCIDGHDLSARSDMAAGSLLSGLALANSGLGVVHGFAGPLGGLFNAPHGAICAALLSHGMAANLTNLRKKMQSVPEARAIVERYRTVARCLTGLSTAEPEDGVRFIESLVHELEIPGLRKLGMGTEDVDQVVDKAEQANSMKANPVKLSRFELRNIYICRRSSLMWFFPLAIVKVVCWFQDWADYFLIGERQMFEEMNSHRRRSLVSTALIVAVAQLNVK